ncbi:hypothetical protein GEMRC1_002941 [Eukaryota sp. GEM-RC1]
MPNGWTFNSPPAARSPPSCLSPTQLNTRTRFFSRINKARANLIAQKRQLTFNNLCLQPEIRDCLSIIDQLSHDQATTMILELEEVWNSYVLEQEQLAAIEDDLDESDFR